MARVVSPEDAGRLLEMAAPQRQQQMPVDPVGEHTDHAARFLRQLSWELTRQNIIHTTNHRNVVVDGVSFDAWCRNTIRTIQFCGKRWLAGSRPYRYDVAGAVEELLRQLPERKKQQEARDKHQAAEQQASMVPRTKGLRVHASWEGELELRFTHPDKATILAAMDCLVEAGFIDDQAPKHSGITYVVVVNHHYDEDIHSHQACYGPFLQKWKAEAVAVSVLGNVVELQEPM